MADSERASPTSWGVGMRATEVLDAEAASTPVAVIGTAVGATNPLTTSEPGAAFGVSEDNVTFEFSATSISRIDWGFP